MKNIIETFSKIEGYYLTQIKTDDPTCFNGDVCVEKYKVTIEKIEEDKEVYQKRLQKLWDECDNHHHWTPIQGKARQLGVTLNGNAGSKRKR